MGGVLEVLGPRWDSGILSQHDNVPTRSRPTQVHPKWRPILRASLASFGAPALLFDLVQVRPPPLGHGGLPRKNLKDVEKNSTCIHFWTAWRPEQSK